MSAPYSIHNRAGRLIARRATLDEVLAYLTSYSATGTLSRIVIQTRATGVCVDSELFLEANA